MTNHSHTILHIVWEEPSQDFAWTGSKFNPKSMMRRVDTIAFLLRQCSGYLVVADTFGKTCCYNSPFTIPESSVITKTELHSNDDYPEPKMRVSKVVWEDAMQSDGWYKTLNNRLPIRDEHIMTSIGYEVDRNASGVVIASSIRGNRCRCPLFIPKGMVREYEVMAGGG